MIGVGVLDYGSGNLHSATRALAQAGADVVVSAERAVLLRQRALVVPGVGSYAACMAGLQASGGDDLILTWVEAGRPLLGICVGHQVLYEFGTENGVATAGLGVYRGTVEKVSAERLPHMGWNTVEPPSGSRLFKGLADQRFYFVHSYAAPATGNAHETICRHERAHFVAAMEHGQVSSTQFHPEKSGDAGLTLLRNWLAG